MRKLKLQVQITVDGYIAGPDEEMDWMVWDWDDSLKDYVDTLTIPVDGILLGRNLASGFIDAWASRANDPETADAFTHKLNAMPKVVFSKTLDTVAWPNTTLAKGDLETEVNRLKSQSGGDLIAYGGASFVAALIKAKLIDVFYLFVNPRILGKGMTIFRNLEERQDLHLVEARAFDCGIAVLHYIKQTP